jgi:hypothetical protein
MEQASQLLRAWRTGEMVQSGGRWRQPAPVAGSAFEDECRELLEGVAKELEQEAGKNAGDGAKVRACLHLLENLTA